MRFSRWAPLPIAVLVATASLAGILDPAIYARETASWAAQGIGQDWIDLVVVAPALAIAGLFALRGNRRAQLIVGGLSLYVTYAFAIYAFAVHFNALFLVYCATLGCAGFALVDLVAGLRGEPGRWLGKRAPIRLTGRTLYAIAGLFGSLWLSQLVPALVRGLEPAGLTDAGLVTNPVHVLDLAIILPAMVVVGHGVQRERPFAVLLAPMLLAFAVAMAIAIGGMVVALYARGLALDPAPIVAMAIVAGAASGVLLALLRRITPRCSRASVSRSAALRLS